VKTVVQGWNRFWFIEGSAHGLAVFRILFGLFCLTRWLKWAPDVALLFSERGIFLPFTAIPGREVVTIEFFTRFLYSAPPSEAIAWTVYFITITALLFMTVGLFFRASTVVAFLCYLYYYFLYLYLGSTGYERIIFLSFVVLLLGPAGKALSLDNLIFYSRFNRASRSYSLWMQRLLCVQIALLYFGSGVAKLRFPAWNSGEMITSLLIGGWASPLAFWIMSHDIPIGYFDLLVQATIVFEIVGPLFLFHRRIAPFVLLIGFSFHLGNALLLNIWGFMVVPLTYVLFFSSETIRDRVCRIIPTYTRKDC